MSQPVEFVRISDIAHAPSTTVWLPQHASSLPYTDGRRVEEYLARVLTSAQDLSSESFELESRIRDWPTRYHLSPARGQILRDFSLDRSARVLEVGSGCGAITRLLGERFQQVIGVEGSRRRASLARLRTRGMDHVAIVNARFEALRFDERFDVITFIGVFEYATMLDGSEDPHDHVLKWISEALAPSGQLVLAIENQFGLKYFAGDPEDHTGVRFDGLEGYRRFPQKARTFGITALTRRLSTYFDNVEYFFPYPDYKLPRCILRDRFFEMADVSELVAAFSRRGSNTLFDEEFVIRQLASNMMLPTFANSFLVVAGNGPGLHVKAPWLGVMYGDQRRPHLRSVTHVTEGEGSTLIVTKSPLAGGIVHDGPLTLKSSTTEWNSGQSIHAQVLERVKHRGLSLEDVVQPAKAWIDELRALARTKEVGVVVPGRFLDCTWRNTFCSRGRCAFIDMEWEWSEDVLLEVVLIRAVSEFLKAIEDMHGVNPEFRRGRWITIAKRIGRALGIRLKQKHFQAFYMLDGRLTEIVTKRSFIPQRLKTQLRFEVPLASRIGRGSELLIRRSWALLSRVGDMFR